MRQPPQLRCINLSEATRLVFERVARATGYPFDAVAFVASALSALERGPPGPGEEDRRVEGRPDAHHVTAHELCAFIPGHARSVFGTPALAREALVAWGLVAGEDVGAIVMGCVEAGWGTRRPGEGAEDFQGLDILGAPLRKRPWWRFW